MGTCALTSRHVGFLCSLKLCMHGCSHHMQAAAKKQQEEKAARSADVQPTDVAGTEHTPNKARRTSGQQATTSGACLSTLIPSGLRLIGWMLSRGCAYCRMPCQVVSTSACAFHASNTFSTEPAQEEHQAEQAIRDDLSWVRSLVIVHTLLQDATSMSNDSSSSSSRQVKGSRASRLRATAATACVQLGARTSVRTMPVRSSRQVPNLVR